MNAQSVLRSAIQTLKQAGVAEPARDARLLLAHCLGIEASRLTLHLDDDIDTATTDRFKTLVQRRADRQPISQILEVRQFYGRTFKVTQDVLDPRPESETLVEQALSVEFETIVDVGTGSGCLLLSLLAERAQATGIGVDISKAALSVAKENAALLGVAARARFLTSDWLTAFTSSTDLIVSNPPYIDEAEWATLEPEPREWEPKVALTPGPDGIEPYRILAAQAGGVLNKHGWLMVEIGWQQGAAVQEIFERSGWQNVEVVQDLGGCDRVVRGQKP